MAGRSQISNDEIAQALLRSGYLIEYQVEQVLRAHHFHVSRTLHIPIL